MNEIILLVDDEEDICEVIELSLSDIGYRVYTAGNGDEALRIFKEIKPSIVLTDIRMPGMSGIELLRKIKEQGPETEVIMITGHGDIETAIESLKYDATDFITKPIDDDILEIALNRARDKINSRRKITEYRENLEKLVKDIFGLSHTIKTIASGLEGGTFIIEKGIELDQKEYMSQGWDMIKTSVDRIKEVSLGILNYSKPMVLSYESCDPNRVIIDVYEIMKSRAQHENVELKMEQAEGLKDVTMDPERINQCLLNLVSNAIEAAALCDEQERKVFIQSMQADGWGVEFNVIDNGIGIEEETGKKIFSEFFSTKGSTGTGVGLMMAKKVIEEHGGIIGFESKEGATKFTIKLPS